MNSIEYKYSIKQLVRGVFALSFILLLAYSILIDDNPDEKPWLIFYSIAGIIFLRFIYLWVYVYLPCLRGETALELDSEKLQYFIKGKFRSANIKEMIFWNDVAHIKLDPFPRNTGALITFKMLNDDNFSIKTTYVAGKDREIYDNIVTCFNKRTKPR